MAFVSAQHRSSAPPWILAVSFGILFVIWLIAASWGEGLIRELSKLSASVSFYRNSPGLILGLGFIVSATFLVLAYLLLAFRPAIFIALWLIALSLGDAQLGIIQQGGLLLRYSMMLILVVLGSGVLLRGVSRPGGDWLPRLFLAYLGLQLAHLIFSGPSVMAMSLLPMQLALSIGVIYGVQEIFAKEDAMASFGRALTVAGMLMTLIACASLLDSERSFLANRFRSWHSLPTGFSTSYILFLIPMVWASLSGGDRLLRVASALGACAGTVLIVMSGTRNALLCLLISTFVMIFLWRRRLVVPFVLVAIVLALGVSAGEGFGALFGVAGERIVSSEETRFAVWNNTWAIIQKQPLWGYGVVPDIHLFNVRRNEMQLLDAHSAYLGSWLRLGIGGAVLVLVINIMAMAKIVKLWPHLSRLRDGGKALILFLCLLLTVVVGGVFEDNLAGRGNIQQAMWAIAIAGTIMIGKRSTNRR